MRGRKSYSVDGLNKVQLFYLESELSKFPKQPLNKHQVELESKKRIVRSNLYECRDCADAKMRSVYDKFFKTMDKEFYAPCKAETCPYKKYFIKKGKSEPENIIDIKKFAEKYFKNFSK